MRAAIRSIACSARQLGDLGEAEHLRGRPRERRPCQRAPDLLLHPVLEHAPRALLDPPCELLAGDVEPGDERRPAPFGGPESRPGQRAAELVQLERTDEPAPVVRVDGGGGGRVALGQERRARARGRAARPRRRPARAALRPARAAARARPGPPAGRDRCRRRRPASARPRAPRRSPRARAARTPRPRTPRRARGSRRAASARRAAPSGAAGRGRPGTRPPRSAGRGRSGRPRPRRRSCRTRSARRSRGRASPHVTKCHEISGSRATTARGRASSSRSSCPRRPAGPPRDAPPGAP